MSPSILKILSCLPIALFSETLRVQAAAVDSILSPSTVAPALTGCVKDLRQLWDVDIFDLFGDFGSRSSFQVASMRHGNSFTLVNRAILEAAGVISSQVRPFRPPFSPGEQYFRPTMINLSFVLPQPPHPGFQSHVLRRLWVSRTITAFECATTLGLAVILGLKGIYVGLLLMICVLASIVTLQTLQRLTRPTFAKQEATALNARLKVAGGASLDIHIMAATWNAAQIHVICGYSSQVHALTNLPVTVNNTRLVVWCCRILAMSLVTQAAALGSQVNNNSRQVWGSIAWMGVYIAFLIPPALLRSIYPNSILEEASIFITTLPPIQFSRRRSALAFLAMLPVTYKVNRWDWLDVFLPPNHRREGWLSELKKCPLIGTDARGPLISPSMPSHLSEAVKAHMSPNFQHHLTKYKEAVGVPPLEMPHQIVRNPTENQ